MEVIALIVAVEEGLHNVREGLQQLGYAIVDVEGNETADAIIYYRDGQDTGIQEMSSNSFLSGQGAANGTFLINAHDKSIGEIDQILKSRSYSPLFTDFE